MRPNLLRRRLRGWIRAVVSVRIHSSSGRRSMVSSSLIHFRVSPGTIVDDRGVTLVGIQSLACAAGAAGAASTAGRARAGEGALRGGLLDGGSVCGTRPAAPPEPADPGARGVVVGGRGPVALVADVPAAEPDLHEGTGEEYEAGERLLICTGIFPTWRLTFRVLQRRSRLCS
jgi:hypothetical protein